MGLREKVALAIVFAVFTRIPPIKCLPRSHLNCAQSTNNVKSPETCGIERSNKIKTPVKEISNLVTVNDSVAIRFPEVEYPATSQASEYYRFQNEYPSELPIFFSNCTCQAQNHKRQLKCKRKYDASTKTKTGAVSQRHCTGEKLFPEVEYPLSARDLWLPTHRNPSQDAIINRQVDIDKGVTKTPIKVIYSNDDIDTIDSKVSTLIKALNTEKQSISKTFYSKTNYSKLLCPKESDGQSQMNVNRSGIRSDINNESSIPKNGRFSQVDVIVTTIMPHGNNNSVVSRPNNKQYDNSAIVKTGADIIPKLGIAPENQSSQDSIISMKPSPTYTEISPGDILTSILMPINTENSDIIPELTISEKSDSSYDENITDSNSGNNVTTPATNLAEPSDKISPLFISEENQNPQHKIVLVSTNTSKTSSLGNCTDNVTPTSNFDNSNGSLQVSVSKENDDDTTSKTPTAILRDIIPEQFMSSSLSNSDDIVTAATRIDGSAHELNRKENESFLENIGSKATNATNSYIIPIHPFLDDFKKIITKTSKTGTAETISQSPINVSNLGPEDNKVSTFTNMSNIDMIPELVEVSTLDNCLDIAKVTNTENSIIPLLFLPEVVQVSSDGIVSTVTAEVSCKNISEPSIRSSCRDCDNIFTKAINTDIGNAVSQLSTADESKSSTDYTVSKLANVSNNDNCFVPFKTNTSFGDYSNTGISIINTKNNDTPELLFSKGCQENFISNCNTENGTIITETSTVSADRNVVVNISPSASGNSTLPKPNIERLDVGEIVSHDTIVDIDKNNFIENETADSTAPIVGTDKKTNPAELTLITISDRISFINTNNDTENAKVDATNSACSSGLNVSYNQCCESTESSIERKNEHLRENLNASTMLPKLAEYPDDCRFKLYDAENLTQHLPVNNCETVKESYSITNEGSVSLLEYAIEFGTAPNSTFQNEYIETYISCNETFKPDYTNGTSQSGFINISCEFCDDSLNDTIYNNIKRSMDINY